MPIEWSFKLVLVSVLPQLVFAGGDKQEGPARLEVSSKKAERGRSIGSIEVEKPICWKLSRSKDGLETIESVFLFGNDQIEKSSDWEYSDF